MILSIVCSNFSCSWQCVRIELLTLKPIAVTDQLPNLRSLALNGKYFAPLDVRIRKYSLTGKNLTVLRQQKLLPGLSTMPYLETLALASSANLHIGFGGWPECHMSRFYSNLRFRELSNSENKAIYFSALMERRCTTE